MILFELELKLLLLKRNTVASSALAELLYRGLRRRNPDAARRFAKRYSEKEGEVQFERESNGSPGTEDGSNGHGQLDLFLGDGRSPSSRNWKTSSPEVPFDEERQGGDVLRAERRSLQGEEEPSL